MTVTHLPVSELLDRLNSGELSSEALTTQCLERVTKFEGEIQAFLDLSPERVLERAREIDRRRAAGEDVGPLAGIPVAIKDVICCSGERTTCGSRMLENFVAPYDAHVISNLRAAGAILFGRVNMDEFAMGSSTENSAFQATRNPWKRDCSPGGSSGGSAAAVAAGFAPLSLGTDTGGSIRQPASFCGVVGLKPTYGRVSRYGLVAYASSLDQIGPMASDIPGAARLLQAIAGHDPRDSTSLNEPVPDYLGRLDLPVEGLKVGLVREHFAEGLAPEVEQSVRAAISTLEGQGAEVREISLPHSRYSVATYYLIAPSEASSNLARYDGIHYGYRSTDYSDLVDLYSRSRGESFGPEVKRRIMLGTYALSEGYYDAYYLKALKVRRLIRADFDSAFNEVDVIVGPTTPTPAFPLGSFSNDPLAMYLNDIYTIAANLAGIPALSIPTGLSSQGLPIGLQIQAPPLGEELLLRVGRMYELASDWKSRTPDLD